MAGQFAIRSIRRGQARSSPDIARQPSRRRSCGRMLRRPTPTVGGADRTAERAAILHRAANEFAACRGDLMGAMLAEGGKTLTESDPEVSEAIDFCRVLCRQCTILPRAALASPRTARGVVVVVSPWNFPLAIPCGGVAGGARGRQHRYSEARIRHGADCLSSVPMLLASRRPETALQFVPCSGGTRRRTARVAQRSRCRRSSPGGTATAAEMLRNKPTMHLLAETGGKNATIVTALSDRDQAIKNVLH